MTRTGLYAPEILICGTFVTDHVILIEDGTILDILHRNHLPGALLIDEYNHGKLVPGFIDIQVNGGGGALFNDDPTAATIETIGAAHRKFGTTTFFPTLISDDFDKMARAITAVDDAITQGLPGVAGIHLEGPFLSKEKKGIHNADKFRHLDKEALKLLSSLSKGKTLVTLAPETTTPDFITLLVKAGVTVAAGHTNATYEQTIAAVDAGVTGFTHLYNAMSAFQSRAPGVVGAAFETAHSFASLIADGFHVHAAALNHAIKTKGVDRSILITDAMPTVGSTIKEFRLGDEHITAKNGKCENAAGILAGSDLNMASAVKFITENTDCSLQDAVTMASLSPAKFLKIDDWTGTIEVGKKANFALLNDKLAVSQVWIDGAKYPDPLMGKR